MSNPSSFDIGNYFNTLAIDEKLSQIIEYNEANTPSQLEYNRSCREIFEGLERLIIAASLPSILESSKYFPGIPDKSADDTMDMIAVINNSHSDNSSLFIFCLIYTRDHELMNAPASLLFTREMFMSQIKESTTFADGARIIEEYQAFSSSSAQALQEHLDEHLARTRSNSISNTEKFEEPIGFKINETRIEFTHPIQVHLS